MSNFRQRVQSVALLVAGAALGVVIALPLLYGYQYWLAQRELGRRAHRSLGVVEHVAEQAREVLFQIRDDKLEFCSDDELALMRRLAYNNLYVQEIRRFRDGHIYCTAVLGRLQEPIDVPTPSIVVKDPTSSTRTSISPDSGVSVAPGLRGVVIGISGVSLVVNQELLSNLDDPPWRAAGLAYDHDSGTVLTVFGQAGMLPDASVVAQKFLRVGGVLYQPLCSNARAVCVIETVPASGLLTQHRGPLIISTVLGAALGMSIASSLILFLQRRQSLGQQLHRAVRKRAITLAYQPIVDLDTGIVKGAESLARWSNDDGESVSPEQFILAAEVEGFIGEISRLLVDKVIDELGTILRRPDFRATVNIAPNDLTDPDFLDYVQQRVGRSGIRPGALAFEVTERTSMDCAVASQAIARLKEAGYSVYLDDFGTGYCNLAYLNQLHVEAIKIDRAFTKNVCTDFVMASVVPQILEMAFQLGLTVVVEGIETTAQADCLRNIRSGILGQGWLFGRAVSAKEFIALFEAQCIPEGQAVSAEVR